jgi:hypothetical protein
MVIVIPLFKKASSLRRVESVSKLKVFVSKISESGLKTTFVPVFFVFPISSRGAFGVPLS